MGILCRWPDFIVIGAMKCATSTLHEQLAIQPGFFMSTPKEPNFFSDDEIYDRGLDWYQSLFEGAATSDLCGESSTHYTKLPTHPHTLTRMRAALPRVKLIYMMRHPIDRLISHYLHEQRHRRMPMPIDEALDRHPQLIDFGRYSMQLEPFLMAYEPENILPVFFERFVQHPQMELERICRFLGYEGWPRWDRALDAVNVSKEQMRESPLRDLIVNAPVLRTIRRKWIPRSWRERVKQFWRIKERPHLSEGSIRRLEDVFDADLARLGRWLDIELSCKRFHEVAATTVPAWTDILECLSQ
jgi:hypothetical protein